MLNLYQSVEWETLKVDIRAAVAAGVKAVFIDPITNLTNGMNSNEVDAHLRMVAQEAAAMALDLDIIIFFFCHLNKPPKGSLPWDRGGKITTDYFAGSSAMARSCNYALGLQGNKDPELTKEEQNMRELVMLADREFGESGSVKLYWDEKTHLFNEV
jgi:twinkle protein